MTCILLRESIARNQINQALFIAVKSMISLKACLIITASIEISFRDAIANLFLHLYEPTVPSKGYSG